MDADPELELLVRQVADLERPDGVEKSERHATDFARVVAALRDCYPYLRAAGAAFTCAPQALPLLARRRRCLTCAPQALPFISYPKHSILFLTCNGRSNKIADPAHHNGVPIGQVEIREPHRVYAHGRHESDEAVA